MAEFCLWNSAILFAVNLPYFLIYYAYKFQLLIDFIAVYKFAFKVYQLMKQAE